MFECVLNMRYRLSARSRCLDIDPKKHKKRISQHPTIFTEQAWSVKGFIGFINIWPKRGLLCGTKQNIKIVSY